MTSRKIFLIAFLVFVCIIFFAFAFLRPSRSRIEDSATHVDTTPAVLIGDNTIKVKIARTPAELSRGLSGTPKLEEDEGMLFIFSEKTYQTFWMKDMLIPLDMIWIADEKIVDISKNVPIPKSDESDIQLEIYSPKVPANYVLEVNAGYSDSHGVEVGDSVSFVNIF